MAKHIYYFKLQEKKLNYTGDHGRVAMRPDVI